MGGLPRGMAQAAVVSPVGHRLSVTGDRAEEGLGRVDKMWTSGLFQKT
jgi:hypothetical protein